MKRKGIALLLLLLILLLTGCGKKTVGVCLRQADTAWSAALQSALADAGYHVILVDADNDQSKQDGQLAELAEKSDLLLVEPVITDSAEDIAALAKKANVPAIFLNYAPPQQVLERWENLCYIGSDLTTPGLVQNALLSTLPDGGDINGDGIVSCALIGGPEDHVDAKAWGESCAAAPGMELLRADSGDWSRESGRRICARQIAEFGKDIEVIFCLSDEMAFGALEALASGGRTVGENVYLVGLGGDKQAFIRVRSGDMTATVCPDYAALAQKAVETAQAMLAGKPVTQVTLVDFAAVTTENVDTFLQ